MLVTVGVAVTVALQRPAAEHGLLVSAPTPTASISQPSSGGPVICATTDGPCRAEKTQQWLDRTAMAVAETLLPADDRRVQVAYSDYGIPVGDGFWTGGDGGLAAAVLPVAYPGTIVRVRIAKAAPLVPACRNGSPRSCPQLTVLDGGAVTLSTSGQRTEVYHRAGVDRFVTVFVSSDPGDPRHFPLSERSLVALVTDDRLQLPS